MPYYIGSPSKSLLTLAGCWHQACAILFVRFCFEAADERHLPLLFVFEHDVTGALILKALITSWQLRGCGERKLIAVTNCHCDTRGKT